MLKILIVDDEIKIRNGLKKWINEFNLNYEVIGEAKNYIEALEIAEKENPDVFLMDINIPMINGLDLSKKITHKYPDSFIIIISGYDDFEYARQALRIKVFDYLLKPVPKTDLYNVLKLLRKEILLKRGDYKNLKLNDNNMNFDLISSDKDLSASVISAKKYIENNYSDIDLSLQKVSNLFNINKTYLSKLMKSQLGYSFVDYMTLVRIKKSKELLKDEILSPNIYEISNKVGFRSQHYFSRVFKKIEGTSPTEYRDNYMKIE